MRARSYLGAAVLFFIFSFVCYAAFRLKKPVVVLKKEYIRVNLSVWNSVPYRVLSALEDGIKVRCYFDVRFRRYISFFLARDPVIAEKSYFYTIKFNFIEGSYSLKNTLTGKETIFTSKLALLRAISRCDNLPVVLFSKLKKGKKYYIEARARIRSIKMYPPFSLLSILSYDTDWVRTGYVVK